MSTQSELDRPAPNAQEIFEKEGYLLIVSNAPHRIGSVQEINAESNSGLLGVGIKVVITERVTRDFAIDFNKRNGLGEIDPPDSIFQHFYKVVAE